MAEFFFSAFFLSSSTSLWRRIRARFCALIRAMRASTAASRSSAPPPPPSAAEGGGGGGGAADDREAAVEALEDPPGWEVTGDMSGEVDGGEDAPVHAEEEGEGVRVEVLVLVPLSSVLIVNFVFLLLLLLRLSALSSFSFSRRSEEAQNGGKVAQEKTTKGDMT